jgi:hypothetical protein
MRSWRLGGQLLGYTNVRDCQWWNGGAGEQHPTRAVLLAAAPHWLSRPPRNDGEGDCERRTATTRPRRPWAREAVGNGGACGSCGLGTSRWAPTLPGANRLADELGWVCWGASRPAPAGCTPNLPCGMESVSEEPQGPNWRDAAKRLAWLELHPTRSVPLAPFAALEGRLCGAFVVPPSPQTARATTNFNRPGLVALRSLS